MVDDLIASIHDFSFSLYTELTKNDNGNNSNMFFSPFSIHVILFLASLATNADTSTFSEIINVIKLKRDHHSLSEYKNLLEQFTSVEDNLKLVNGLFVGTLINIDDQLMENSINYLKAHFEKLDFQSDPNARRQYINTWISEKTNRKINELFPEGSINTDTVLVFANAMHFKSVWKHTFDRISGYMKFYINPEESINVKMMQLEKNLKYYHDENLKYAAVQLPYELYDYSMIIILPDENNLKNFENNIISKINLSDLQRNMKVYTVNVHLPGFKIDHSLDLKQTLTNLGCSKMFMEDQANFSKFNNKAWINNVMHKACIEVDENATEAAASTVASYRKPRSIIISDHKEFKADHPFIFFILSQNSSILFVGRIAQLDDQSTTNGD